MPTKHTYCWICRPAFAHALALNVGLLLVAATCPAQSFPMPMAHEVPTPDSTVYTVVQQPPKFPGGLGAYQRYLRENLRYPVAAKAAGVSGRVFVSFVVRNDGRITDILILKGLGSGCDEEAVRVVRAMPRWQPGRQSGRPLNVKYNLPLSFGL